MKYDFLIVGSGFFGATFAHIASKAGKSCLVIDKKDHIAGAAFDRKIHGINVSQYGAHIFHTHSDHIWQFVKQFGAWEPFTNRPKVISGGRVYSFPINLMTLHQAWGVTTPAEAAKKLKEVQVPCADPRNFEEWALSKIGRELYDLFIYGYTKKQYHREPRELPASIIQRLPIRLTFDENYFTTCHQGVPRDGYTSIVKNMLEGSRTELCCHFGYVKERWRDYAARLVYTGPIDEYFDYTYGRLDYNTLRFEHKEFRGDQQGNAVINWADESVPYLRSVEHKHFIHPDRFKKHYDTLDEQPSIVSYDIPAKFADHPEPYYPILDDRNLELHKRYAVLAKNDPRVIFGGRLGEYRYYDLDQTIASAMAKAAQVLV